MRETEMEVLLCKAKKCRNRWLFI